MNASYFDLSQFELGPLLGRRIHEVYLASHKLTSKTMALKIINSSSIESHFTTLNEIDSLYKCRHPNIVKLFGYSENSPQKTLYVFMEKLDLSFKQIITERKKENKYFTIEEINILFDSVLSAFWYLETKEKPHGDFRPENLMVKIDEKNGYIYKIIDIVGAQKLYMKTQLTKEENEGMGYAAPEILEAVRLKKINCFINYHKSDVFSVGLVLLGGCLLEEFGGEGLNQGTNASRKKIEKKIGMVEKMYGGEISDLIDKMVMSENSERFSFEEIAEKRKLILKKSYDI